MGRSTSFSASVGHPSTLRMLIWPEASRAQNNMAAVSADGSTVCVLIRRLNSSCSRSIGSVLDDLIGRGLRRPEFLIVDGAPGLEKAIAVVWDGALVQRCTVHKHRNLLAHAPERMHEEIGADYTDMIYAATPEDIAMRRKGFIRKW